jgi:hypothetical protein
VSDLAAKDLLAMVVPVMVAPRVTDQKAGVLRHLEMMPDRMNLAVDHRETSLTAKVGVAVQKVVHKRKDLHQVPPWKSQVKSQASNQKTPSLSPLQNYRRKS